MRVIDLSAELHSGLPVYPGDPPVSIEPAATVAQDGFAVARLELSDQAGTHVETQAHFLANGRTLADVPLERLIGRASIVDVPCGPITVDDLAASAARISSHSLLVLRSGYAARGGAIDPADAARPRLALPALRWLVSQGVRLLGIDAFDFDADAHHAGHRYLLAHDVLVVEGLVNLASLPNEVDLYVIPLRLRDTGGAPCRAFAIVD